MKPVIKISLLAVALLMAETSHAQSFLTNGLVAYYPFNGNANDASGNGYNLINNGATFGTDMFGNANSAAVFDSGTSIPPTGDFDNNFGGQWMSFGNAKPVDNLSAATVSMWLNTTKFLPYAYGNASGGRILYQEYVANMGDSGGNTDANGSHPPGFGFCFGNGSSWYGTLQVTNGDFGFNTNGTWIHCVLTADASGQKLFANGVLILSGTNTFSGTGTNSYTLGLGAYYNGSIDNLRIYNRALSSDEVAQLYSIESGQSQVTFVKAFAVDFQNLLIGSNYQAQASPDLVNWTNWGAAFTATSSSYTNTNYQRIADWNQLFFRMVRQ